MNNKAYAFVTGLFVLLLAAGVIIAAVWLSGSLQKTKPYVVVTTEDVNGLAPQSNVTFRGIVAGKVTALRLDPDDPHRTRIDIAVASTTPVTRDTYAVLKMQLTGLSQLALQTTGTSNALLATSAKAPARIAMRPSLLDRLSQSASQVMAQLDTLATSLNAAVDPENRAHLAALLAHADLASARLARLTSDLDVAARRLPGLSSRMESTLQRLDALSVELDKVAASAGKLSATGVAAGEKIDRVTLPRLDSALARLGASADEIRRLSRSLHDDPQQFLMGPPRPPPGPGERGYRGPSR
ncbi:MAG TPA: MlaD family protein [Caldimonas sp.]|nr:MlaD family protein [Caldimonas sp.]